MGLNRYYFIISPTSDTLTVFVFAPGTKCKVAEENNQLAYPSDIISGGYVLCATLTSSTSVECFEDNINNTLRC
jgi:hypothetical protein